MQGDVCENHKVFRQREDGVNSLLAVTIVSPVKVETDQGEDVGNVHFNCFHIQKVDRKVKQQMEHLQSSPRYQEDS